MTPTARRKLGDFGESHARRFLEDRGYMFVAANWTCGAGELDLVMRHGDELVIVEIKTRRGEEMGRAEEAITPRKAARLLATAEWFLAEHPAIGDPIWRIDLIALTLDGAGRLCRTSHIVNAIHAG